jgi:homoserine/homoserine lactone efflux protein
MYFTSWLAFLCVSLAAAFSPGPGVLMAISTASTQGPRSVLYSSAGNALGVFTVAALATTGLGLLLHTSALAFAILKAAGAAYLVYLGLKVLLSKPAGAKEPAVTVAVATPRTLFVRGMLIALSNPKAILFFTAVFPQFMPPGQVDPARFLLLASTFTACTLASHFFYVRCASWARRSMGNPRRALLANRVTALLFMGMGGALLTLDK